ncbi:MAG: hypothetical protein COA78_36170 [Blastopirellula sp.]|nr:MAG: hypothetical protein COA78_36170 [Blastopirellula sp.]
MHLGKMNLSDIPDEASELLEDYCDFVVGVESSGLGMLPSSNKLSYIAGDGMGGCFYRWMRELADDGTPIVYLSQYGEASRFATDMNHTLAIVVAFPGYWCDVLTAVHKNESLVTQVIDRNEATLDDNEPLSEVRSQLRKLLSITDLNPIPELLKVVKTQPQFVPELDNDDGTSACGSFAERPFPTDRTSNA